MWGKAMSQDIQRREGSVFWMVNHGNMTAATRAKADGPLFEHVIEPWRDVLFRFNWVRSSCVTRLETPIERPLDINRGGGGGMAEMQHVTRYCYEHWIAHTSDQPPSGTNGWSMALEEFLLGGVFHSRRNKSCF